MLITIHSYKGGTGKTLCAINLAYNLAKTGNKVCLIDLDLRAPSICSIFQNKKKFWINDYLNQACKIEKTLNNYTPKYLNKGNLFVCLADPSIESIRKMASKDRKWEMNALGRIINMRSFIYDKIFDYVIIDSSPGLQYSSINAIVASDMVLMMTSVDQSDVKGTERMLTELYDIFDKKTGIIMNKMPPTITSGRKPIKIDCELPIIEFIPCSCDILNSQGEYLSLQERADHPVAKSFQKIAKMVEKEKNQIGREKRELTILVNPPAKS